MRFLWAFVVIVPLSGQVCDPRQVDGAYGFQLSGTTTISGGAKPVVSVGRLEFDGQGGVSGAGSVNFAGYFLGNPVTGSYQAAADCSLTWSLQDDSGAFQHFAGVLSPDLRRATFHQTDRGGPADGTLVKVASECSTAGLAGGYRFAIRGSTIPMEDGQTAETVSYSGDLTADAAGNLSIVRNGAAIPAGTAEVDSDCTVQIQLSTAPDKTMAFRGVLTSEREILAIETDPGTAVGANFRPR